MPELPEVQAHAERLADDFVGRVLVGFRPLTFTALKTAQPAPDEAYGQPLTGVGRRGKYILLDFESVQFAVHLMQGGRLPQQGDAGGQDGQGRARLLQMMQQRAAQRGIGQGAGGFAGPANGTGVLLQATPDSFGAAPQEQAPQGPNGAGRGGLLRAIMGPRRGEQPV